MSEGSYVALEQGLCPVCGVAHNTGVLLDKRLKPSFKDKHVVTHWEMCEQHQKLRDDGYVALVAIDEERSVARANGEYYQEDVYRIRGIVHLKMEAFDDIFSVPHPERMIAYCSQELIDFLKEKVSA